MPYQGEWFRRLARGANHWLTLVCFDWLREQRAPNWRILEWESQSCRQIKEDAKTALPPAVFDAIMAFVPEDVVAQAALGENQLLDFLNENYLTFFSDIDEAADAADALSISENFASSWHSVDTDHERHGRQRRGAASGGKYAVSISTRGLLYANKHPLHPKWAPLIAPRGKQARSAADTTLNHARTSFSAEAKLCSTRRLMSLDLPYHPQAQERSGRGSSGHGWTGESARMAQLSHGQQVD